MAEARLRAVALIVLAVGVAASLIVVAVSLLYDAKEKGPGLSDNATLVLAVAFAGIIGVAGAYVGFRTANGLKAPPANRWPGEHDTEIMPPR